MGEHYQSIAAGAAASSINSSVHLDGERGEQNGNGIVTSRPGTVVETSAGGDDRHKLFLGTFIHNASLAELKYRHKAAVCVSKEGTIVAIEDDCDRERAEEVLFPRLGWSRDEVQVITASEGQFFFPGFIGMADFFLGTQGFSRNSKVHHRAYFLFT